MRTLRLALLAAIVVAASGCVHVPCPCDDPELNPRRPGYDGRSSASLDAPSVPRTM